MPTDVLIIGDSHTRALQSGCDQRGLKNLTLTLSGTAWFEADVHYNDKTGLKSGKRKWVGDAAVEMGDKIGTTNPFQSGLPVLLSCMNLGRVSARFKWRGHEYAHDPHDLAAGDIPVSRAMMHAFVEREILRPLELVGELAAAKTNLVVVAPPSFSGLQQPIDATATFTENVRAMGVSCFNPWEHHPPGATTLPGEFAHQDGRHGNDAYGAWAVDILLRDGLLNTASTSQARARA